MKRKHDKLHHGDGNDQVVSRKSEKTKSTASGQAQAVERGKPTWRDRCRANPEILSQLKDTRNINFGQPCFSVSRLLFLRAEFWEDEEEETEKPAGDDGMESAQERHINQARGEERWKAIHSGFERAQQIQKCIKNLYGNSFDSMEVPFSFSVPPSCSSTCSLSDALQRASEREILRLKESGNDHDIPDLPPSLGSPKSVLAWLESEKDAGHEEEDLKSCYENVHQGGCLANLLWAQCNDGGEHGGVWLYSHDRDHQVVFGVVCFCVY